MDKLKKTKTNKKSEVYENKDYIAKIKTGGLAFPPKRYADDYDAGGPQYFDVLELTSKKTMRTATTRVFQIDPIGDLNTDLKNKSQFKPLFDKID